MGNYTVTFSCGHEGNLRIDKGENWKFEYAKDNWLCPACRYEVYKRRKKLDREEKEAEIKEISKSYPELSGSEKQIAWATVLRYKWIEKYYEALETLHEFEPEDAAYKNFNKLLEKLNYLLFQETDSRFFINNRDINIEDFIKNYTISSEEEELKLLEKEAFEESTIIPEKYNNKGICKIELIGDTIMVTSPKDENIIKLLKKLNYSWKNYKWQRTIKNQELCGKIDDRMAEIGNELMQLGFGISILDEDIREKAINGEYKKEQKYWVLTYNENKLLISFPREDRDMYNEAKKLPKTYYEYGKGITINISCYKDIEDFAEINNFSISEAALKKINKYKELESNPVPIKKPAIEIKKDTLKEILKEKSEVLDDLKDED